MHDRAFASRTERLLVAAALSALLLFPPGRAGAQISFSPWIDTKIGGGITTLGHITEIERDERLTLQSTGQWKVAVGPSEVDQALMQLFDLGGSIPVFGTSQALAPPGTPSASGSGTNLSGDGSCAVGHQDAGFFTPFHAFRWTAATGPVDLGTLDPPNNASRSSFATDTSTDCSVVVGFSDVPGTGFSQHAFRWTAAGGMVDLGASGGPTRNSRAFGVSGDGNVVVGDTEFADGSSFSGFRNGAFRWTPAGGFQELGALQPGFPSLASAVTADGSVVVGQATLSVTVGGTSTNGSRAFRWTAAGGMQAIGPLPGHQGAVATAVSDNGSVVVGTSAAGPLTRNNLGFVGTGTAFRWTEATGIQDLKQALVAAGADLTGIELVAVTGLSRDGQWISGEATTPASAGQTVAFIVQYCDAAIGGPCRAAGAGSPFLVAASATALTVAAGSSASTQITVTPSAGFAGPVTFSCSGLPAGATCSFAPATVTPSGGPVSTTLTVATGGGPVAWRWPGWPGAAVFACAAVVLGAFGRRRERRPPYGAAMLAVLMVGGAVLACGGGGGGGGGGAGAGTPAGKSTVTVTATSGSVSSSVPLSLTVTR